ncbi:hypothetical protein ACWDR9_29500 [Streptosporangium sandarakinum]|uniref:hypothetical protein n=1 Tax=Streptosporangium sandarakinum TaxID=1260955 RepID=UPI00368D9490
MSGPRPAGRPGPGRADPGGAEPRSGGPDRRAEGGPGHRAATGAPSRTATVALPSLVWRFLVWACGTAALLAAMPPDYRAGAMMPLFAALLGLLAAAEPEGVWVLALEVTTVGAWLVTTVAYGHDPSPLTALAIGSLLYVHHAMAALAAHVPVRARLPVPLLTAWAGRTGGVLAASAAVCAALTALVALPAGPSPAVAVVLGAAGALAVAFALTRS